MVAEGAAQLGRHVCHRLPWDQVSRGQWALSQELTSNCHYLIVIRLLVSGSLNIALDYKLRID